MQRGCTDCCACTTASCDCNRRSGFHRLARRWRPISKGRSEAIDSLPVKTGGTEFQRAVWAALRTIRTGTTTTYGRLAVRLGQPKAMRAVGMANGANPIGIIVPCHRVIGANATLTGYGGGIERKRWLLRHEGALPMQDLL